MLTRVLLTMLALFAGLAAQIAPAQARMGGAGATEIGASLATPGTAQLAVKDQGALARPVCRDWTLQRGSGRKAKPRRVYIPTLQLGVDRAHE